jgi:RNA polymerase sigma-70 factor (ECF subfamily)
MRTESDASRDAIPQAATPTPLLVGAARAGDRDAFGRLYAIYGRMVHGIVLARVPPAEADDLVQDVFLSAWQRLDALREPAAFGAWLATMARRRAADWRRQRRDMVEVPDDLAAPETPEAESLAVLALVRTLPEAYRETLVMRLVEGMTGPEIAARTGLTPGSVRVNLHRGFTMLRQEMAGRTTDAG